MLRIDNLQALIELEKFRWVKQDLLPLFGLLDIIEETGDGYFCLPFSLENLSENLMRITKKPKSIIEKELEEFERDFSDFIEVKRGVYYYTSQRPYRHPPSKSNCDWETSATSYILKPELMELSKKELNNLKSEPQEIFNEIIVNVRTIEDLLYLCLLKKVISRFCDYSQLKVITRNDLQEIMEITHIDKEIIEYALKCDPILSKNPFLEDSEEDSKNHEKMQRFLPKDQKCFAILYSHHFNSSSCRRMMNIRIKESIAQYISAKLDKVPIIESIVKSYNKVKSEITKQENRLPLFTYKDYRLNLMSRYYRRIIDRYNKFYVFEIIEIEDSDEFREALRYLEEKGIIKIKDDEITLNSEDKFNALFKALKEEEDARIDRNKKELLIRWLRSGVDFVKPPKPSDPQTEQGPKLIELSSQNKGEQSPSTDYITLFLGISKEDKDKEIFWSPGKLNNGHFIIIGGSGAGKTETIKTITSELNREKFPVLLIDFHGDMAYESSEVKNYIIKPDCKYYFNPLELNMEFEELVPLKAGSDFAEAIAINSPNFGIQQKDHLKEIIKRTYEQSGITDKKETWSKQLEFNDIKYEIKNSDDKTTQTINPYLRDIFDYGLFSGSEKISIVNILNNGVSCINLKPLPESVRSLYADLFLRKLYYSLQALGEIPRGDNISDREKFRLFVIVDEAKLLLREDQGIKAVLNKYATELRKFGAGLILASQVIDHFPDEILSNVAVKLCMKTENKQQAKKISKFFGANEVDLVDFQKGEGILIIGNEKVNIKIVPTSKREKV